MCAKSEVWDQMLMLKNLEQMRSFGISGNANPQFDLDWDKVT